MPPTAARSFEDLQLSEWMAAARRWARCVRGHRILEVDDLNAVAYLGLTRAMQTWRSDRAAKPATYVVMCVRNAVGTAVQREFRNPLRSTIRIDTQDRDGYTLGERMGGTEPDKVAEIADREWCRGVLSVVGQRDRAALELWLSGASWSDMAREYEVSRQAVQQRIRRAVQRLRALEEGR